MNSWVLAVAGWDQGGHEAELKKLCDELGVRWSDVRGEACSPGGTRVPRVTAGVAPAESAAPPSVLFLGPQYGDAKAACYANCDAFILPSFSEGLPMVVLEAWAYGKPVLMTPECNLPVGYEQNAARRIETNPESIAQGLADLLRAPRSELHALGQNGLQLVRERYQWPEVAHRLREVYAWLLGGGPKPPCVIN